LHGLCFVYLLLWFTLVDFVRGACVVMGLWLWLRVRMVAVCV